MPGGDQESPRKASGTSVDAPGQEPPGPEKGPESSDFGQSLETVRNFSKKNTQVEDVIEPKAAETRGDPAKPADDVSIRIRKPQEADPELENPGGASIPAETRGENTIEETKSPLPMLPMPNPEAQPMPLSGGFPESLKKFEANLRLVQKSEQIFSLHPKMLTEVSAERLKPSVGKIALPSPKQGPSKKQRALGLLAHLGSFFSRFVDHLAVSNDYLSSSEQGFAALARSMGPMGKKHRYQPKLRATGETEMDVSVLAILKVLLFLKMLFVIFQTQLSFASNLQFRVLSLALVAVLLAEYVLVRARAAVNGLLDRGPNYLVFDARLKEPSDLGALLKTRAKGARFRAQSRSGHSGSQEVRLKQMAEVASAVKSEFVRRSLDATLESLRSFQSGEKLVTGYRNNRLMLRSPETRNFEYLEGRPESLLQGAVAGSAQAAHRRRAEDLQEQFSPRKDVIYFMYLRPSETGSDTHGKVSRGFKVKFKRGRLKVEYFGCVDARVVNALRKFLLDYEHFVRGPFLKLCLKKAREMQSRDEAPLASALILGQKSAGEKRAPEEREIAELDQSQSSVAENPETPEETGPSETPVNLDVPVTEPEQPETPEPPQEESPLPVPQTKEEQLRQECRALVAQINKPEFNLNLADHFDTERELRIAKRFLEVFQTFQGYYSEEDKWRVSDQQKEYTAWARDDGSFVVRKAEMEIEVDVERLEQTMKNLGLAHKWNPLLGRLTRQGRAARGN